MNGLETLGVMFIAFIIFAIVIAIWWKTDCYFEEKREQQDKRIRNMVWREINMNKEKEKEKNDLMFRKLEREIQAVKEIATSKIVFVDTTTTEKKKK